MLKEYINILKNRKGSSKRIPEEQMNYNKEKTIKYLSKKYPELSEDELEFLWIFLKDDPEITENEIDKTYELYSTSPEYKKHPNRNMRSISSKDDPIMRKLEKKGY